MSAAVKKRFDGTHTRRLATLITIDRTDGISMYLTDHDSILIVNGFTFQPAGGFSPSAQQGKEGMAASNMEILGVLDASCITHEDLRAGRYLEAKITYETVDWLYPWAGSLDRMVYWITDITFTGTSCTASLASIRTQLNRPAGMVYTKNCSALLGDSKCQVDMTSRVHVGAVTVVRSQASIETNMALASDLLTYGHLTWLTGANVAAQSEVSYQKTLTDHGTYNLIKFYNPPAAPIQVGDIFSATEGCDFTPATCKNRFNNLVNYRGVPWLPGNAQIVRPIT